MSNNSGLIPVGRAVLIETYEPQKKNSLIILPPDVQDRARLVETRATVIDIGPAAWDDEKVPRAMIGDRVLVTKFAGNPVIGPLDGKPYRLVNDRDIYCRIVKENDSE